MISIYIRPDKTQIIKAKIKKDKTLNIVFATEIESYWQLFKDHDMNISALFRSLKALTSTAYEEIYIVLPDMLFFIDCYDYIAEEDLTQLIKEHIPKDINNLYMATAILCNPGTSHKKTIYAIEKEYIDDLIIAAAGEKITLTSIEPASIGFFRSQASWQHEHFTLEIFEDSATFVSFSPIAGVFKLDEPKLSEKKLLSTDIDQVNQNIAEAFVEHDFTAHNTFSVMNINAPFDVITDKKEILENDVIKKRLANKATLPPFVITDIATENQQNFMSVIGTLMQNYECTDEIFTDMPPYLTISSANMLPEQIRLNAKFKHIKHIIKKSSQMLIIFLSAIIFAETAAIIYYSNIQIPPDLQMDYDKAQKDIKAINAEIKIINDSKKEDEYPMKAFTALIGARPNNCGFANVSIGTGKDTNWVKLTAAAPDPIIFQNYIAQLNNNDIFNNITISKITTDVSGLKIADIEAGKGNLQ
ncbi:hypothetical protein [Pectinatus frisingensis]|uniref:hypothetical protein n=1 Tax=Pectinatus frisingensis TaxID=865 RepID=UPI003D807778